jgi:diguanylate cyclase (GGDEF)-like protein
VSRSTAVLFVDLDRFKQVNDTLGHAAGDAALRRVADQLVKTLRPMDTVARIGGDEFGILIPNVASEAHAVDIGNRLLAELSRRPQRVDDGEPITASLGIAISTGGRGTAESLLHDADTAMYQAKSLGGGRAAVYDKAFGLQIHERSIARRTLQSALDDGRVLAHYQPIIDLAGGTVTGFEALARIAGPDDSIVFPGAFIPVAEENGLVIPLGTRVLELACAEASGWKATNDTERPLTIAVNLSARQFEPGDLVVVVRHILERTAVHPTRLHLELTETAIVDLRPDILKQLGRLTDLGVEIGLDDFGTGYASLTHLRHLPLSFVKIDQSFVHGLGTDMGDERIVAAVVDLAANLGLRSIAEGVETSEQLAWLREFGCHQAQGYLFARPLPAQDVPAALDYRAWPSCRAPQSAISP